MILIFLNWIIVGALCLSIGDLIISLFIKINPTSVCQITNREFKTFLVGMASITWLANICSIFTKVNLIFFSILFFIAGLWFLFNLRRKLKSVKQSFRKLFNTPFSYLFILGLILFIALFKSCFMTENADQAGYYLQLAKWIENYSLTPGTALLNGRIGFNSAYHMTCSIFSQTTFFEGGLYDLNGLLYVLFHFVGLAALLKLFNKENASPIMGNILLASSLIFPFSFLVDSMDVDFPTIFIGIFLVSEVVNKLDKNQFLTDNVDLLIYAVIALYLFTVRPFSLFYLVPVALFFLHKLSKRSFKIPLVLGLMCCVYIAPWLIRNYYISGYLIYPMYYLDFFNPEWKLPISYAENTFLIIKEYAKIELIREDYLYTGVINLGFEDWIGTWISNAKQTLVGLAVIFGLPLSILGYLFVIIRKRISINFKIILSSLLLILVFWFLNFPSIRFAWAFIFSFMALTSSLIARHYLNLSNRHIAFIITALLLVSGVRTTFKTFENITSLNEVWLKPQQERKDFPFTIVQNEKLIYKQSTTEYCGAVTPPCMPNHNPYKVKLRGESIKEGFAFDQ